MNMKFYFVTYDAVLTFRSEFSKIDIITVFKAVIRHIENEPEFMEVKIALLYELMD